MTMRGRVALRCLLWAVVAVLWLIPRAGARTVQDFTFAHVSDIHIPHAADQTRRTLAALPTSGVVALKPYNVTVPAPSFVIDTGDINEFGGGPGGAAWEEYLQLWRDIPIPVYRELGNHDNTWDCGRTRLRGLHGSPFYAFEKGGVKFIGWDSATPQDPRPSIAEEGVEWLKAEFARTPPEQPVILFCHHPLDGREFAGEYHTERLFDLLRTRNVVLLMAGHSHRYRAWKVEGFDSVMGGSTWSDKAAIKPGFSVISIKDGVLRVCYHQLAPKEAMIPLLEKPLPSRSPFLQVVSLAPADGKVFKAEEPLEWTIRLQPSVSVTVTTWTLDGKKHGALIRDSDSWKARLSRDGVEAGAHSLRLDLADGAGHNTSRSVAFWIDGGPMRVAWKEHVPGSCEATPTFDDGHLYIGANDGGLYAFDAATGKRLWAYSTKGEARTQPAIIDAKESAKKLICFGSAEGAVYALSTEGALKWRFDAGSPVYSSPAVAGAMVVFGTNSGKICALDAQTGKLIWQSKGAGRTVETRPFVSGGAVYFGAWDGYLYALDQKTGEQKWRKPAAGSDGKSGNKYLAPADCSPIVAGDAIFVANRAHSLLTLDARAGQLRSAEKYGNSVSLSNDGQFIYVEQTNNKIAKRRPDGSTLWTAPAPTGFIVNPPQEGLGLVWVVSEKGTVSALDRETGKLAAQYKAFPDVFAMAGPAFDAKRVFLADMAGDLLALTLK